MDVITFKRVLVTELCSLKSQIEFFGDVIKGGWGGVMKITPEVRYPTGVSNCEWPLTLKILNISD